MNQLIDSIGFYVSDRLCFFCWFKLKKGTSFQSRHQSSQGRVLCDKPWLTSNLAKSQRALQDQRHAAAVADVRMERKL